MTKLLGFNKKAQTSSWFTVIIFLFVFIFITFISYLIMNGLISAYTDAGFYTGVIEETGDNFLSWITFLDKVIVFLMTVFIIGAATTTYRLASGPTFYIIVFIQAAIYGFISYLFNYIFIQIVTTPIIASISGFFPLSIIVCTNLHWVMLALIFVGSIAMFGKKEKGQFLT